MNDCLFVPERRKSPSLFGRVSKHRHYTRKGKRTRFDQACDDPQSLGGLSPFARKITFEVHTRNLSATPRDHRFVQTRPEIARISRHSMKITDSDDPVSIDKSVSVAGYSSGLVSFQFHFVLRNAVLGFEFREQTTDLLPINV